MSRIFITGIAGVLGTALHRELLTRGHEVFGCDLFHSHDPNIVRADVANMRELEAAFHFRGPQMVIHLAGEFGRMNGQDFPEKLWSTNCIGTHNVIEICRRWSARLVFASSSEAYGDLSNYFSFSLNEDLLINTVPRFHNEYSLTKWVGEKQIEIARRKNRLKAVSLRFFNVYGPGEHFSSYRSVVCQFVYRLLHRQPITVHKGSRDFLYIADWARTVSNIADEGRFDDLRDPAYNIGGAETASISDLAAVVSQACGNPPGNTLINLSEAETNNVFSKTPDIKRAQRDLDHNPAIGLVEGVHKTVEWMRKRYNIPK